MRPRNLNPRLAKINRNYDVGEVAHLYCVHKNTVREWIKQGLQTCDQSRPTLIVGRHLSAFHLARRVKNKRTCKPGEIYCVRCREPKEPAGDMAELTLTTTTLGNLVGICPTCESLINRCVNAGNLALIRGKLDITLSPASRHIG